MKITKTPQPPYYAVIATTVRTTKNAAAYDEMGDRMEALVAIQPGYIGHEFAKNEIGINISYWESLEAIKNWKQNEEHLVAQLKGKQEWYQEYKVRICKVEKDYEFSNI